MSENAGSRSTASAGHAIRMPAEQAGDTGLLASRLRVLARVIRLISSNLDQKGILGEIAQAVAAVMGVRFVSFWLADDDARTLSLGANSDDALGAGFAQHDCRYGQGMVGWVAAHRRALQVDDALGDPRSLSPEWWKAQGMRSFYGAPVLQGGRLLAVLGLIGDRELRFDDSERELLDGLCAQAAVSITNARLYGELQDANASLERRVEERTSQLERANRELVAKLDAIQQTEAALREAEERYRSLIENADDPMVVIQHGRLVFRNRAHIRLVGERCDEVLARGFLEFVAPEDQLRVGDIYERRLRGEQAPDQYEIILLADGGGRVPVEVRPRLIRYQGQPATLVTMRDISLRKEAEALLESSRRAAEAASEAKSEFLATMSHEIRTPMNGVIGMTELMLETELSPEQRDYAETIRRSGEALLSIVNDVLDLSKLEAGKLDLHPVDFSLRTTVDDVLELLVVTAYEKRLDLGFVCSPEIPERVYGDPGRLRQVLVNLVGNALKFTETGAVTVRATLLGQDEEGLTIRISVCDTGIGISPTARVKLFQPFGQADGSTTRRHGGTGLGLAISKRLVEMMGGAIGHDEARIEGSEFYFTVRLGKVPGADPAAAAMLAGRRVLAIDDDPVVRELLQMRLSSWGMMVDCAGEAQSALARVAQAEPPPAYDIVLVDDGMVLPDGAMLASAIEGRCERVALPVVLLTSWSPGAQPAAHVGRRILRKPLREVDLRERLAEMFGMRDPDAARARRHRRAHRAGYRARVLVVEDNVVNQTVAVRMIALLGHRVDVARNGYEAVAAAAETRYDCIFMDCQMPGMDGFDATRAIRQGVGGSTRAVVIAMTANVMSGDRERCFAAGMDDYLAKPVTFDSLQEILSKWRVGEISGGARQFPPTTPLSA